MAFSLLLVPFIVFMVVGGGGRRTKRACRRGSSRGETSTEPTPDSYRAYCDEQVPGGAELPVGRNSDFRSDESYYRHHNIFRHNSVIGERSIILDDFPNSMIVRIVNERNWGNITTYSTIPNITIVKEFYSNLDLYFSEANYAHCFVRGVFFTLSPRYLSSFLDVPLVNNPGFPFSEESCPSLNNIASLLTGVNRVWDGSSSSLKHSELTNDFAHLHVWVTANLCPVFHKSTINKEKAFLMYALATNVRIDLGLYLFKSIVHAFETSKKKNSLPFGSLITSLCKRVRVSEKPSDEFGNLGPTYNLAAFNKRLSNMNRLRQNPNVGVNQGNQGNQEQGANVQGPPIHQVYPEENVEAQHVPQQGENVFTMENMWNMINTINTNVINIGTRQNELQQGQNELRQFVFDQNTGLYQRMDDLYARFTQHMGESSQQFQGDDDEDDVLNDDDDEGTNEDEDDDGDDDD